MTAILGLNAFHPDSSACLLVDGKLVGAVAEERLGPRNKHTMAFPENSIRWLLDDNGLRLRDITHVAIARDSKANFRAKLAHVLHDPRRGLRAIGRFASRQRQAAGSLDNLAQILGEDPQDAKFKQYRVEHHIAHIASAYYLSPFENLTAGLSYDGSGDFASAMAAKCEGNKISVIDRVTLPHSLGHFYTALCQFIGFDLFGEEYKVMGLAPYGEDRYQDVLEDVLQTGEGDWFRLNPDYFNISKGLADAKLGDDEKMRLGKIFSEKLVKRLGPPRRRGDPITQREMDIARSTQVRFEAGASACIETLSKHLPLTNIAMAGGCALNGVMNARIYRDFPVENVYLQSAASDDGTALGAAFHCWHMGLGEHQRFEMTHSFWGPEYSESRILRVAESSGYSMKVFKSKEETIEWTADQISAGAVLGWYQGRSEWGPRALGNRSILANPGIANMKDIINKKIKKRESFRPFAPSVLKEEVSRFFEQDINSPFMMHVVKFRSEWRDKFPAVTHVDGTGRLQSVDEKTNPLYYALIKALAARTGYGIVLNTSFNENEPVVDTPEQAVSCFKRTDMDVLVMGNVAIRKESYQMQ